MTESTRDDAPVPLQPEQVPEDPAWPAELGGLAAALVRRLDAMGGATERLSDLDAAVGRLELSQAELVRDLRRSRGRSLRLVVGSVLVVVVLGMVFLRHGTEGARAIQERDALAASLAEETRARSAADDALERVRGRLLERERALTEVTRTVERATASLAPLAAPLDPVDPARPGPQMPALNAALRDGGVTDLRLVDARLGPDGGLVDVLMVREDELGRPLTTVSVTRAWLAERDGVLRLQLQWAAGGGLMEEALPLPTARVAEWSALGLAVPVGFRPVGLVAQALASALLGSNYRLTSLGGHRGGELRDLDLVEAFDESRTAHARLARIEREPPTLVLLDGETRSPDGVRAFWKGEMRLPLVASSLGALTDTLGP